MTTCHFRDHRECSCPVGACDQIKPMLDLRDAPVITLTAKQQLFGALLLSLLFSALWFGGFYCANVAYGKQAKINQESDVHVSRR